MTKYKSRGEAIKALRKELGLSQDELAKKLNTTKQTIYKYENGIITNIPSDKIEIMSDLFRVSPAVIMGWDESRIHPPQNHGSIPVMGRIPAGTPLDAVQDIRGYIDVPTAWVDDHGALIVIGDSMSPKYLDGDTVIFRIQPDCESGQDCVAYVNGYDATLKKVIKNGTSIVLQPINPEYAPIVGTEENPITILGVVVELRRKV